MSTARAATTARTGATATAYPPASAGPLPPHLPTLPPAPHFKPPRILPTPLEWETLPTETLEQIENVLLRYVPAAVTARLRAGQQDWLADFRRMTVMFVGVGGLDYTADLALEWIQTFLSDAQKIIYRYEGSLNKLVVDDKGTVLLILFGAPPLAHEDDPIRALACARELQQLSRASARMPESHPAPDRPMLDIRIAIGITSNTVFAGPMGSPTCCEYTVMGDDVNLAARLMQLAGPGRVLCDQSTYGEARKRWSLEALSPMQVKGKTEKVQLYRFAGLPALTQSSETIPLVGRDHELAALGSYLERVRSGMGCVVSVIGEGGIGKTRLTQEFIRRVTRDAPSTLTVIQGTAHSIASQTPYLVWREVLTISLGLESLPEPEQRTARVSERARNLEMNLEHRLPLLNDILDLGVPETPATRGLRPNKRRENLAFLVVQLLNAMAQKTPLVIVLDDMHWADSLSWDLALDVARAVSHQPILLLLCYRSPDTGEDSRWGHEKRTTLQAMTNLGQHHTLPLTSLDAVAVAHLAASHLDNRPVAARVAAWLVERSQGNPFFVEETVRMLREQSALMLDETGTWQLVGEQCLTAIPSTIQGIIQTHLDRLQPNIQLTCKVASVVGRIFPARVVAGVYPVPEEVANLWHYLDILAQQEITPLESYEPELRYQFKSAVTQDVAYHSLLQTHRQELHKAVAEWYEREYTSNLDPYIPLIADHYRHAEQWLRFLDFAERAGKLAAANYATAEALTYLSQAIDLLQTHPTWFPSARQQERLFRLLLARQEVYRHSSHFSLQERDLDELTELAEAIGDTYHQAILQTHRAYYFQAINDYEAADQAAKYALKLAKQLDNRHLLGENMNVLARSAELRANYHQALWWGFQALEYCREVGDRHGEARSLHFLGVANTELGDYAQAETYLYQALDIRQDIEDRWGEATSLYQIGSLHMKLGRPRDALKAYDQALTIRQAIGDRSGEAFSLLNIGNAYHALGDMSVAQRYQREALTIWRELGNHYGEAMLLVGMSEIATALGDFEAAQQHAVEGLEIARSLGNRQIEGSCLSRWGNASREQATFLKRLPLPSGHPPIQTTPEEPDPFGSETLAVLDYRPLAAVAYEHHRAAQALASELGLRRLEAQELYHLAEWEWEWSASHISLRARPAADYWDASAVIRREIGEMEMVRASRCRQAHALVHLGDLLGARKLVEEVWEVWGSAPPPGEDEDEIRKAYLSLYHVWLALGEYPFAIAALAWAYQAIQDRAIRISDPDLRHSFLTRVSVNLAIIETWNATIEGMEGMKGMEGMNDPLIP
ncbi:MAG: tetratricopeptide repeat protein [Chloroflexaceae bacterium]|nr:tetratricopeptide repeat protein [Chloroflexaceae bacterium]